MKLTTIIPVHNAEKYITATLDSVLQQDLGNPEELEVICVDDASTDASVALIKDYQQKDSRIRLFLNEKTRFAGACRNKGIEEAHGDYLHFLDADDLVEKGAYQKYLSIAEQADADMIKGCAVFFDNETGELSDTPLFALSDVPAECFDKVLNFHQAPEIFSHISVVPWNAIYKRKFILEKGLRFNNLICVNDRSFYSEAVFTANRIWLTHEQIVRYRVNNSASLVGNRARNFHCEFDSWQLIMNQCTKYNIQGRELAIVMERELIDIFIWYRKYKKIPEISEEKQLMAEKITSIYMEWEKEADIKYPNIRRHGRPAEGIGVDGTVSVRNYLKCELYTYSAKTLALFILSIEKNPEYNRYLATMQKMVQAYGYSSLEEAEKEMA